MFPGGGNSLATHPVRPLAIDSVRAFRSEQWTFDMRTSFSFDGALDDDCPCEVLTHSLINHLPFNRHPYRAHAGHQQRPPNWMRFSLHFRQAEFLRQAWWRFIDSKWNSSVATFYALVSNLEAASIVLNGGLDMISLSRATTQARHYVRAVLILCLNDIQSSVYWVPTKYPISYCNG